jgi:hypothetical protein
VELLPGLPSKLHVVSDKDMTKKQITKKPYKKGTECLLPVSHQGCVACLADAGNMPAPALARVEKSKDEQADRAARRGQDNTWHGRNVHA